MRIIDPLRFLVNFAPASYLQDGAVFDFADGGNRAASQLFGEVVSSLAAAFSLYTNDAMKGNRITKIQQDSVGFAQSLSEAVETAYQWRSDRGLEIVKTAIISISYDENTRELLKIVQRADALAGARGNSNLEASVAAGLESAGAASGASGILGVGIATNSVGLGALQQPMLGARADAAASPSSASPREALMQAKELLEAGLITEADYETVKARVLGL